MITNKPSCRFHIKYDVELIATDNLGTLKEVPLTDDAGTLYQRQEKAY
jgi:hypothetical protein